MGAEPKVINGRQEMDEFLKANPKLAVVIFMEDWSENCVTALSSLKELLSDAEMPANVGFGEISAESNAEICAAFNVTGVPTIILFHKMKEEHRITGLRVRELAAKLVFYSMTPDSVSVEPIAAPKKDVLNERIKKLLNQADVMLFMKGTPQEPQCGFSRTIVQMLNEVGLPYSTFNILADNEIREGLKDYSNWKTYPQLYVKGELIGGLDIVKELKENGDLEETLKA